MALLRINTAQTVWPGIGIERDTHNGTIGHSKNLKAIRENSKSGNDVGREPARKPTHNRNENTVNAKCAAPANAKMLLWFGWVMHVAYRRRLTMSAATPGQRRSIDTLTPSRRWLPWLVKQSAVHATHEAE